MILIVFQGCFLRNSPQAGDYYLILEPEKIARRIENHYQSRFNELSENKRGHLSLRLYRISGEKKYRKQVENYAAMLKGYFLENAAHLNDAAYVSAKAQKFLEDDPVTAKEQKRREFLNQNPEILFKLRLLYLAAQLKSFGLDQEPQVAGAWSRMMDYLKAFDFKGFLMQEEVMRYQSAKAVNAVYNLKQLGLMDIESEFIERYRNIIIEVIPGPENPEGAVEFENKIYGMTHFMIADSGYYQNFVSEEKWRWVLEYLAAHLDEITARTKSDVIAEVGLCFKLAGFKNHPVIVLTQTYIMRFFDPAQNLIPSVKGGSNLNFSEHRNAVALLLLKDFETLYPGPQVYKKESQT